MNLQEVIEQIEDYLCPQLKLNVWEKSLYYYLFRHTLLFDKRESIFSITELAKATDISDFKVREVIRSLDVKGCVKIINRSLKGHLLHVFFPNEIETISFTKKLRLKK